ncbi:hypothetical protein KBD08_02925 [Candidatus Babeliales bacterium]|nr:hypothetical protein [Candidatus Babeliales bacterium]
MPKAEKIALIEEMSQGWFAVWCCLGYAKILFGLTLPIIDCVTLLLLRHIYVLTVEYCYLNNGLLGQR